jgi:hypothetical protein
MKNTITLNMDHGTVALLNLVTSPGVRIRIGHDGCRVRLACDVAEALAGTITDALEVESDGWDADEIAHLEGAREQIGRELAYRGGGW